MREEVLQKIQKRIHEFCGDMNFRRKKHDRDYAEAAFVEAMKLLWDQLQRVNQQIDKFTDELIEQHEQNQISGEVANFFDQDKLNDIIAARKERLFEKKFTYKPN